MTGTNAAQRKTVHEFKYPNEEESAAQQKYYREAKRFIKAHHEHKHQTGWLSQHAQTLFAKAQQETGPRRVRLNNNARSLKDYEQHFSKQQLTVLNDVTLTLQIHGVKIKVTPDLHVTEKGQEKIIKLDFTAAAPDKIQSRIIAQVMYEAANANGSNIPGNAVLYLDLARGNTHRGARAGSRMNNEIEAACATITAIWNTISE